MCCTIVMFENFETTCAAVAIPVKTTVAVEATVARNPVSQKEYLKLYPFQLLQSDGPLFL